MGITAIGERTTASFGVTKINRVGVSNEEQQLDAGEYNRVIDGLIEVQEAIGTAASPGVGSIEARIVSHASEIETLDARTTAIEEAEFPLAILVDNLTEGSDRQVVTCEGYSDVGDGGDGDFAWRASSEDDDDGGTIIAVPGVATGRWHRLFTGPVRPRWFGAVGDGVTDDTTAMQACFGSGYKTFDLEGLTYAVTITPSGTQAALKKWTSETGITINGHGATILDLTHWDSEGASAYQYVFWFSACTQVRVLDVNFTGQALSAPGTYLGYRGPSFVNLSEGTSDVEVTGRVRHAVHGVNAGTYLDHAVGGCKNIKVKLDTYFCGYPIAFSYVDGVDLDITADSTHRAVYLAGVRSGRVVARFKNQYLAPVQVLMTEAIVGASSYRACSDLVVSASDIGSTTWVANSWCAGIAVQRLQPVEFANIDVRVYVRGTDSIASTLGAFAFLNNGASYWDATSAIRNVTLRGMIDRSAQTVADHASGEIYLAPINVDTISPVCENIVLDGFVIKKGSATPSTFLSFRMPALASGGLHFKSCDFGDHNILLETNTSAPTRWSGSRVKAFASFGAAYPQAMSGCSIASVLAASVAPSTKLDSCSVASVSVLSNVATSITASTTQTQGQMPLTAVVNDVTTCANANDTVTLPTPSTQHPQIWVLNNGAQTLQIFPPSGCDLGAGTNTSVTLAAGAKASWAAVSATVWRRLV